MATLMHFFNKLAPSPAKAGPTETHPAQFATTYESVHRLRPLLEHKRLLTVELAGQEYQSLLLAMDIERGLIWLDELFPRVRALETGDRLHVSYHHNGQAIRFSAPVAGWGSPAGVNGIALPLPQEVYSGPRRRWPRLEVFGWHPISARLAIPGRAPVSGEVLNLSAGGLRLGVTGDWRPFLRRGELLPLCEFTAAPGLRIRCRARVCAFNISQRPWRQTRVSLAFVDLQPELQQSLVRFVEQHLASAPRVA